MSSPAQTGWPRSSNRPASRCGGGLRATTTSAASASLPGPARQGILAGAALPSPCLLGPERDPADVAAGRALSRLALRLRLPVDGPAVEAAHELTVARG